MVVKKKVTTKVNEVGDIYEINEETTIYDDRGMNPIRDVKTKDIFAAIDEYLDTISNQS